jgi:hypothetical protein
VTVVMLLNGQRFFNVSSFMLRPADARADRLTATITIGSSESEDGDSPPPKYNLSKSLSCPVLSARSRG